MVVAVATGIIAGVWKFGVWYGKVNRSLVSFEGFMTSVRDDLKEIRNDIRRIFRALPSEAVTGKGPVQLTEFGKRIAESVNSSEWAKEQATDLVSSAKDMPEYEVFDLCVDRASKFADEDPDFITLLRKGAYECGTSSIEVIKVFNVELRDAVLNLLELEPKRDAKGTV